MDNKHVCHTVSNFLSHVQSVDPYTDNAGKLDRFVRAVIMAYDHDARRTGSDAERSQLNDLESAYKAYKAYSVTDPSKVLRLYHVVKAYHVITSYNPTVSYKWAIDSIYDRDHR